MNANARIAATASASASRTMVLDAELFSPFLPVDVWSWGLWAENRPVALGGVLVKQNIAPCCKISPSCQIIDVYFAPVQQD
jgi:hypothetical protein